MTAYIRIVGNVRFKAGTLQIQAWYMTTTYLAWSVWCAVPEEMNVYPFSSLVDTNM
jgi:hypothetical protein